MWEKLEKVNIEDKEIYLEAFKNLIKKIKSGNFNFKDSETGHYYLINEEDRMNSKFVYIVPKEIKSLFDEMKKEAPDEFLGFSVLVNNVRVSCFGIPCSLLSQAIIKN